MSGGKRLLDNAEFYLEDAVERAKEGYEAAKQNLKDWRDDRARTEAFYRKKEGEGDR